MNIENRIGIGLLNNDWSLMKRHDAREMQKILEKRNTKNRAAKKMKIKNHKQCDCKRRKYLNAELSTKEEGMKKNHKDSCEKRRKREGRKKLEEQASMAEALDRN